jgi:RNA polymerase sigma-70 factor (ECF subfamily)
MDDFTLWKEFRERKDPHKVFEVFYDRHSPAIYSYCLKILESEEMARDVIQEVFLRLYEKRFSYENMTNLQGFLIRSARNQCLNIKGKKIDRTDIEDVVIPHYDSPYYKKQLSDILSLAIEELPDEFKEPLLLKEYMNMSYKEIAEILGETLPVVRVRIFRAKNKLKKILHPYLKELESID